jgi:CHAD domain-containing protein
VTPQSYRLQPDQPLRDEVVRVALGRIDNALAELRGETESTPEEAVHEARKDMKKLRSLLRLVRAGIGSKLYREGNQAFREAGLELSGTRDLDVLIPTLESLELDPAVSGPLRQALEAQRLRTGGRGPATSAATDRLVVARERVTGWSLGDGFDALAPGLERAQLRGRRAMRTARREPTADAFHDWRKRSKDLWYHQLLLRALWPPVVKAFGDEAHELSARLGDDHDLAMLLAWAHEHAEAPAELIRAAEERRAALQADAFSLGARLYADRPAAFARRHQRWWEAASAEAAG